MRSKHLTAIPRVIDRFNEVIDVEAITRDIATRRILDSHFYHCAQCKEPVHYRSGGATRRDHFAHLRAEDHTPSCIWRTERRGIFAGRNKHGDDGEWHIQTALEIMTVLDLLGLPAERNANVLEVEHLRKPDIRTWIDGQEVRFEIQATPTNPECARRRSERDLKVGAVTIWTVSTGAFEAAEGLSAWLDNLRMLGGGQLWCWDQDCLRASLLNRALTLKRIDADCDIHEVDLREILPRNVAYRVLSRPGQNARVELYSSSDWTRLAQACLNEAQLIHGLANDGIRALQESGRLYDYKQGNALLNVPSLAWAPIESGRNAKALNRDRREYASYRKNLTA